MSNTDAIQIPVVHYPCGCGLDHHAATLTEERIRQIVREELVKVLSNPPLRTEPTYVPHHPGHPDRPAPGWGRYRPWIG